MDLSDTQLKTLKEVLVKLHETLAGDIESAKAGSKPVQLDQQAVGRVSRVDAIQQQQMQKASLERLNQRFSMVESALNRMKSGNYGYCLKCEEPISYKRLSVRPESTLCLDCAQ